MNWRELAFDRKKLAEVESRHDRLWNNAPGLERLVIVTREEIVDVPWVERFENPERMFEAEMQAIAYRCETEDDSLPTCRVNFGTGLMASVFGVDMLVTESGIPFASHDTVIRSVCDLRDVDGIDPLKDGELGRLYDHMEYFQANLPPGVHLSQADLQGPWNTAHLIRGDAIFTDVYDAPELVEEILGRVAAATTKVARVMKEQIGESEDAMYLHGGKSRGGARVCNCTTDMISPDYYRRTVLEHDIRFLNDMGGGFVHICGHNDRIVTVFNEMESLTGLEFNFNYIDLFAISDLLRSDVVLMCTVPVDPPLQTPLGARTIGRLLKGEAPDRRNIVFCFNDPSSLHYARQLVEAVRSTN